jgi:hypothetical protein
MTFARIICLLSALVCLGVGAWSVLDPGGVAGKVGYVFAGPAGQVEFVTVYGGFYLGLGLFLVAGAAVPGWLEPALAMSTLGASGAFVGRLAGLLAVATTAGLTVPLLVSEAIWAGASAVGWYRAWKAQR